MVLFVIREAQVAKKTPTQAMSSLSIATSVMKAIQKIAHTFPEFFPFGAY